MQQPAQPQVFQTQPASRDDQFVSQRPQTQQQPYNRDQFVSQVPQTQQSQGDDRFVNYGSPEYPQYVHPDEYDRCMKEVQRSSNTVNYAQYPYTYQNAVNYSQYSKDNKQAQSQNAVNYSQYSNDNKQAKSQNAVNYSQYYPDNKRYNQNPKML